jgi:hypothetical protein
MGKLIGSIVIVISATSRLCPAIHVRNHVICRPKPGFSPQFSVMAWLTATPVLRIDPAVIAPDNQAAPTGESRFPSRSPYPREPLWHWPSDKSPHSCGGIEVFESRNCSTS